MVRPAAACCRIFLHFCAECLRPRACGSQAFILTPVPLSLVPVRRPLLPACVRAIYFIHAVLSTQSEEAAQLPDQQAAEEQLAAAAAEGTTEEGAPIAEAEEGAGEAMAEAGEEMVAAEGEPFDGKLDPGSPAGVSCLPRRGQRQCVLHIWRAGRACPVRRPCSSAPLLAHMCPGLLL